MNKGGSTQNSTQTSSPPAWAMEALNTVGTVAPQLYRDKKGYNVYTGPTQAPMSDARLLGMNNLMKATGNKGGAFEEHAYLAANPDVAANVAKGGPGSFASGLQHWDLIGQREGRAGLLGPITNAGLQTQRDTLRSQINGGSTNPYPPTNGLPWDEKAYLAANPDVAANVAKGGPGSFASGLQHWQQVGQSEGRSPTFYSTPSFQLWGR